jgi:hypothetical protein
MVLSFSTLSKAQVDPNENEAPLLMPNNTLVLYGGALHRSSAKQRSLSTTIGQVRADYNIKFGAFSFLPIVNLLIQDVTLYSDQSLPSTDATGAATTTTVTRVYHNSGLMDLMAIPTLIYYGLVQDPKTMTHTWIGLNGYIYFPTGGYDKLKIVNPGENRWTFRPQLIVGQRFLKAFSVEAYGSVAIRTGNDAFMVPIPTVGPVQVTLDQALSFGGGLMLSAKLSKDFGLSACYSLEASGEKTFVLPAALGGTKKTAVDSETIHTFRLVGTVAITPLTHLILTYSEDIAASTPKTAGVEKNLGRYVGMKFAQVIAF